jgi:hypothetical protein
MRCVSDCWDWVLEFNCVLLCESRSIACRLLLLWCTGSALAASLKSHATGLQACSIPSCLKVKAMY